MEHVCVPVYVYARARTSCIVCQWLSIFTVEVSEVVSSLSRVSTTCPRSLTIRCLYRLSSIYTTTIHVLTSPPSSFLTVTLLIFFLFLFNSLSPFLFFSVLFTLSSFLLLLKFFHLSSTFTVLPHQFPLSYRLPFSRLSPHVFLFFCLFPHLVTTSANEQATRLESPRVEPREPRAEVHRTPSYPYLRTRGMCCQEFSLTMDLLC